MLQSGVDLSPFYNSDHWWLTRISHLVGKSSLSITHKPERWSDVYNELEHALAEQDRHVPILSFEAAVASNSDPFLRICYPPDLRSGVDLSSYVTEVVTQFISDRRKFHPIVIEVLLQVTVSPVGMGLALILPICICQNNKEVRELILNDKRISLPDELIVTVCSHLNMR